MRAAQAVFTIFLLVAINSAAAATTEPYGWTISASDTDPYVNVTEATFGLDTFYLWLACCDVPDYPDGTPRTQGGSGGTFALIQTGIQILAATPGVACSFGENPPPPPDFFVVCFDCPCGPKLVASLLVFSYPGSICFAPSVGSGHFDLYDCEPQPQIWGMDWIGIDTTGEGAPCSDGLLCQKPTSANASSWGQVKGLYRQ